MERLNCVAAEGYPFQHKKWQPQGGSLYYDIKESRQMVQAALS